MYQGASQLIGECETAARKAALALEWANRLPDGFTEQHYPLTRRELAELLRFKVALRLARDRDTCRLLLLGLPVEPERVDERALRWAQRRTAMIRLVSPFEVLR